MYDLADHQQQYDLILCTEVLEHVVDPVRALEILVQLTKPGGKIIFTCPHFSFTHFAPHHHATGFSKYFLRHHFDRLGCTIETLESNGGFFDVLDSQLKHASASRRHFGYVINPISRVAFMLMRLLARLAARGDGPIHERRSRDFANEGWHVIAQKAG